MFYKINQSSDRLNGKTPKELFFQKGLLPILFLILLALGVWFNATTIGYYGKGKLLFEDVDQLNSQSNVIKSEILLTKLLQNLMNSHDKLEDFMLIPADWGRVFFQNSQQESKEMRLLQALKHNLHIEIKSSGIMEIGFMAKEKHFGVLVVNQLMGEYLSLLEKSQRIKARHLQSANISKTELNYWEFIQRTALYCAVLILGFLSLLLPRLKRHYHMRKYVKAAPIFMPKISPLDSLPA